MQGTILVTGGAGFIGMDFVLTSLKTSDSSIVSLDRMTYAGNPVNPSSVEGSERHSLVRGDTCDAEFVGSLLWEHKASAVVHFAAESHVDRSIVSRGAFIETNAQRTFTLLEQAKGSWLIEDKQKVFRFLHVSTDKVYGTLGPDASAFLRDNALRTEPSVRCFQGRIGPPGACVLAFL